MAHSDDPLNDIHTQLKAALRPTVEAIVVSYNSGAELGDALSTLLRHHDGAEGYRMSVAVWDNASVDGSADLVGRDFPDVRLIKAKANVGFGHAVNALAASSEADYLLLLNPDLVFNDDVVTPLLAALNEDPEAFAAGPRLRYPDGTQQYSAQSLPDLRGDLLGLLAGTKAEQVLPRIHRPSAVRAKARRPSLATSSSRVDFLWATCWLMRRTDAVAFGPFDERFPLYDEDVDLSRRLRSSQRYLRYVPDAVVTHIGGASSTPAAKARLMFTGRCTYYRVHSGTAASLTYATAYKLAAGLKSAASHIRDARGRQGVR